MDVIIKAGDRIKTEPLEGEAGRISLQDVVARPDGAPFTAGVCGLWSSQPVEFGYDDDCAVCYFLDGEATLTTNGEHLTAAAGDVAFIPQQAGLKVLWDTSSYVRFFYVTYPHWR